MTNEEKEKKKNLIKSANLKQKDVSYILNKIFWVKSIKMYFSKKFWFYFIVFKCFPDNS